MQPTNYHIENPPLSDHYILRQYKTADAVGQFQLADFQTTTQCSGKRLEELEDMEIDVQKDGVPRMVYPGWFIFFDIINHIRKLFTYFCQIRAMKHSVIKVIGLTKQ